MSETITASLTVSGGDVITAEINTLARGPAGPTGESGASTWDDITGAASDIPFLPVTAPAHSEGLVFYDSSDKSLVYYNEEADVAMNIGREMWVRVRNDSGSAISNGKVVYINDAQGQLPTIRLARADSATTSRVIGIATHDIGNNEFGYVTSTGEIKGLATNAYNDGDLLFLSAVTAGEMTTTAPLAPNRVIQVATVLHAHPTQGKLYCHPETDSIPSTGIVDSTATGRSLVTAANAAAARTTLEATATGVSLFTALTPAAANAILGVVSKRKATQTDRASTTAYATDSDFTIPVVAGKNYRVEFAIYTTAGAGGFKGQFVIPSVPADITTQVNGVGMTTTPAGLATGGVALTTGGIIGAAVLTRSTSATNGGYHGWFEVTVGATGGNLLFQWGQNSPNAINSSVLANSSVTAIERSY